VIVALGITWVLDGLEVTLAGAGCAPAFLGGPMTRAARHGEKLLSQRFLLGQRLA
jgi:hypothetical protein